MSRTFDHALVILNPWSGRGQGERAREELARLLRGTRTRYDIVETERPGHAIELALAARLDGYPLVVAAGGDGTISEVVNGLMLANEQMVARARQAALAVANSSANGHPLEPKPVPVAAGQAIASAESPELAVAPSLAGILPDQPPAFNVPPELETAGTLGVIPVGSGNDFATMVGIPANMAAAVKLLEHQRLRLVDVGSADIIRGSQVLRRYFDNNMGIGLEAQVTLESYKIRRLRGTLLYVTAAIRALLKKKSPHMHIRWELEGGEEGSHEKTTLLVSVGNSPRTGGGFYLTPDARLDDKLLDVAIAEDLSKPRVLALLPRALVGKHTTHPAVTMLRIQKLIVQVPEGAPVQMDGEVVEEHAFEVQIGVIPHKLELIA